MSRKIALVTGATSGIGKATALLLAENGFDIIACGRRKDRLEALQKELRDKCKVHLLSFDVRDKDSVAKEISSLSQEWSKINLLVNNAGNAHGLAAIQDGDLEDWDAMIDINVKGLLYVSKAVIPGMVARGIGQIINIGSIAGKEVYPNGNVYCASKFAVDALTAGMRRDLYYKGIRVSQVCPGMVETEFGLVRFKGDEERAASIYKGYQPLTAEDVADAICYMATRPAHVNVADMLLLSSDQAASTMINKK